MSTKPTRTPVVDEYLASMMEPVTKLKEGFNPMTDNDLHKALHGHHGSADRGSREAPRSAVVPSPARPLTATALQLPATSYHTPKKGRGFAASVTAPKQHVPLAPRASWNAPDPDSGVVPLPQHDGGSISKREVGKLRRLGEEFSNAFEMWQPPAHPEVKAQYQPAAIEHVHAVGGYDHHDEVVMQTPPPRPRPIPVETPPRAVREVPV